jgi:hypothetical protein
MARPILTDAERLDWERFPADPGPDVVGAYFTLADGEVDVLRRLPTPAGRLATAVAMAAIRWLGFVPADLGQAPAAGVQRLAGQLDADRTSSGPMSRPSARRASIASARRGSPGSATLTSATWRALRSCWSSPRSSTTRRSRCCGPRRCGCVSVSCCALALSTLERLIAAARARAERETHELRFDVYCREKGWLDPMGFLDRRETDVDDAWAHRSGARLVLCAARRRG